MDSILLSTAPTPALPLTVILENEFAAWLENCAPATRRWLTSSGFKAKAGSFSLLADAHGALCSVLVAISRRDDLWALGGLPAALPEGVYSLEGDGWEAEQLERLSLGWALGAYQFTRYKKPTRNMAQLVVNARCNLARLQQQVAAITLVRDLINTPAEHLMPEQLAATMQDLATEFSATCTQIVGIELLAENYPLIHAVGRASVHEPRLLDLRWGNPAHPLVTLVGKGVCFDSGGLDLKPSSAMRLMKKDMGGAALVLGLARLIMSSGLPIRLRVLIAAVENAVAGNALRPGDVVVSRHGLSVEIHNTDAEGRLLLGDLLSEAVREQPALLIDFATLTGAARSALGTELPALFCNDEQVATGLLKCAEREQDPCWRLPLHCSYRELLDSKIADIANASNSPYGGAITAALFLKEFIPAAQAWAHFDLMAWNLKTQAGRPEGGEAMTLRAVFAWLEECYRN